MSEPTTAEKCRVVAERWLGAEQCWWHSTLAADAWCLGNTTNDHSRRPIPDIPNDPVAANALWDALSEDGYYVTFFNGIQAPEERHYCRLEKLTAPNLIPDVWMGRNANKWAALLDAAYQATLAEGQP